MKASLWVRESEGRKEEKQIFDVANNIERMPLPEAGNPGIQFDYVN